MEDQKTNAAESDTYVCLECGADVAFDAKLCPKCGADISEIEENEPKVDSAPAKEDSTISDFFSFRKMISPILVRIIYIIGLAAITIRGLVLLSQVSQYHEERIWIGLGIIVFGNIVWRIICEGLILLFRIHEILRSIEKQQRNKT